MATYSPTYGNSLTLLVNKSPLRKVLSRLGDRIGKQRAIMVALNGAAAGGTATLQYSRVQHSVAENGLAGQRTIETRTVINRVTTAADEAAVDADLIQDMTPTYPDDAAGGSWKL